ncbi:unnamed protein product, partial [Pleuronectes platessa]
MLRLGDPRGNLTRLGSGRLSKRETLAYDVNPNLCYLGCKLDQPEAEVDKTRLFPAAAQALWCCRAPGNAPIRPDVKTIQLTREFPHLPSESESLIPSMESGTSQNTHCNRCA